MGKYGEDLIRGAGSRGAPYSKAPRKAGVKGKGSYLKVGSLR